MDTMTTSSTTESSAVGARAGSTTWPAVTAWGAGLIQIALGAGAIMGEGSGPAVVAAGFLLIAWGVAALGWGAATLARGRIVVPRAGVAGSLIGIIAIAVAFVLDPARVSVFAVTAASALLVAVALGCALVLRRGRGRTADAGAPADRPNMIALITSAVLVAALVTPALSATEAGQLAPDHGDHGVIIDQGHH